MHFCLVLHLNKYGTSFSDCRPSTGLSSQIILRSIEPLYLLLSFKINSRSCVVQALHAAGTARIIRPINTGLFLNEMFFPQKLIFFFPCLIMLNSFDLNAGKFLSMVQNFVCESLVWLKLEGVLNFSKAFGEFVARDYSVASLSFIGRDQILSVVLRILPKCSTLNLILDQMLLGLLNNMFFFEGHCWRWRC